MQLKGDEAQDRERLMEAASGPVDCVLDLLPPVANPSWARAAVMTVRQNGRAVLMGGVGLQGGGGLELPYAWIMRNCVTIRGQWMYPREAAPQLIAMIRSGLLRLDCYDTTVFDLDHVNEAVAHAATHAGPFEKTVLQP